MSDILDPDLWIKSYFPCNIVQEDRKTNKVKLLHLFTRPPYCKRDKYERSGKFQTMEKKSL